MLITQLLERVWIVADSHLGHGHIVQYANRPFANVDDMDRALITAWNAVVRPDDWVYHLGDFTLGDIATARKYFAQLNGLINVLYNPWHHDKHWLDKRQIGVQHDLCSKHYPITLVLPIEVLEVPALAINGRAMPIILCHYPFARWNRSHYGSYHLFGHCHNKYHPLNLSMDVGVDAAYRLLGAYQPFSLAEIARVMQARAAKLL